MIMGLKKTSTSGKTRTETIAPELPLIFQAVLPRVTGALRVSYFRVCPSPNEMLPTYQPTGAFRLGCICHYCWRSASLLPNATVATEFGCEATAQCQLA